MGKEQLKELKRLQKEYERLRRAVSDLNLGVQVFDLAVLALGFLDLVRENTCHAFDRLPLPRAHLRWVKLLLGCYFLNRLVTAQRFKRHSSFNLV